MKNQYIHRTFTNHHNGGSENYDYVIVDDHRINYNLALPNRPPDAEGSYSASCNGADVIHSDFPNGWLDWQRWILTDEESRMVAALLKEREQRFQA